MIKSVTVTNYLGQSFRIVLEEAEPDHGMLITNMDGIGPPKADINTTNMATSDGSIYNSARVEQRNIVLTLMFTLADSIEDTRQRTYKYFPIKKPVGLLFETDNRMLKTTGYVESNEPNIFSSSEMTQLSIICPDPYFYSEAVNTTVFSGMEPLFEFIFSNESLEDPLLEFGLIHESTEQTVYYDGDADTGVTITIHALGPVQNITVYNIETREKMRIDTAKLAALTGSGLGVSDDIIIKTSRGEKSIQLLRSGQYTNILNCLDRGSDWFTIRKGDNIFAYTAELGEENLTFTIENRIVYEGV